MDQELITKAKRDGRNLAAIARTRLTPAHDTLLIVYAGLFYKYLPFAADTFKEEFFKNIGSEV